MSGPRKEHIIGILGWIVLGLVASAIARRCIAATSQPASSARFAVGVVGAIVGGLIASAVGIGGIGGFFSVGTWVVAIAGALLLLIVYGTLAGEGRSSHTAG